MAIQFHRGTAAQNDAYTGPVGSLSYDTTNSRFRIHDGLTAGGFVLPTQGDLDSYATQTDLDDYAALAGGASANFSLIPQVAGDLLISSGANADGGWVRFSNGTQICESFTLTVASCDVAVGTGFITKSEDRTTWTYPQAFVSAPVVTANFGTIDAMTVDCTDFGAASTKLLLKGMVARTGLSNNIKAVAFGRWK